MSTEPSADPTHEHLNEHERRVVAIRTEGDCRDGKGHVIAVKLSDDTVVQAPEVIAAIDGDEHVHYTMIPPEGAPAYQAWQETGLPLLLQTRDCPDCGERVLFA